MEERFTIPPPMQLNSMVVKLNSGAILLFAPVRIRDEVSFEKSEEIRKHLLHFTSGKHTRRSELLSQHSVPLLRWEISQCKKVPVHVLNLNIAKDLMN